MDKEINTDTEIGTNKDCVSKEVDVLAVSMKPSPVISGEVAKRLLEEMNKPSNNAELFKKCKESALKFKEK